MNFPTDTDHGHETESLRLAFCSMLSALGSLPYALSSLLSAPCPLVFALCALLLPLTMSGPAEGGSISITTQVTVSVTGERIHGLVTVTNNGNVPAHRVRVDIALPGARIRPQGEQSLGVARSAEFPFEARPGMLRKGRHPLSVMVHFQDSIGHPFSALSVTTFLVQEEKAPELLVGGEPLIMGDRGTVRFQIENTGPLPKAVKASLVMPRELLPANAMWEATLSGGDRKDAAFSVTNLSALSGATYPIFCIVEYDLEGTHQTVVGTIPIHITARDNWFRKTRWHWAGGGLLLGMTLAAAGMLLRRRRNI